jgi:two-component system LytT family response regulator
MKAIHFLFLSRLMLSLNFAKQKTNMLSRHQDTLQQEKQILTAVIVDDENFAVKNLSNLITSYCSSIKITDTANNAEAAIQKINSLKPNVVFMDINMPEKSGFDILNHLIHIPLVVFVTAHEKYALRAMKVCAVDFLLKPIDITELIQTETKLIEVHSIKTEISENYGHVLRNLTEMLHNRGNVKKVTILGTKGYEILETDDILYLTGEDNYTSFHFLKQKEIMVSKTLKDYEEMLDHFGFMRIHKSTLVNLAHVKKVIRKENVEVLMSNGVVLSVSRRRVPELLEWTKKRIN